MAQDARTKAALRYLAGGTSDLDLAAILAPGKVNIMISSLAAREPQGQLLFSFAVNLLARLHPVVQQLTVVIERDAPLTAEVPRWRDSTLQRHVLRLLSRLNPPARWHVTDRPDQQAAVSLVVGASVPGDGEVVAVGSHGWLAFVSPIGAVPVEGPANPIGAYGAACLGVGEVWKRLIVPHRHLFRAIPVIPIAHPLAFSTLTYQVGLSTVKNPELPISIDLGRLTVVGIGAGGGAALYTLASTPNLAGSLCSIEPDHIDDTNLNRYVFADAEDDGHLKLEVAQQFLARFDTLTVTPHPHPFAKVAGTLASADLRHVVAAVHSREARREIQLETPEVMWDAAAAEDGEFRVWRLQLGITECMYCKHPPGEEDPEERKGRQLTNLLGLEPSAWLRKLKDNEPFTDGDVAAITERLTGQSTTFSLPRPGQPFGDWEASQCGKLVLPDIDDAVPIPFAPVMAGVLLAGELIKERHFPAYVLDSYYWNTLLGQFVVRNRPHRRAPTPNCSCCSDEVYRQQYRRRWRRA